MRKNLRDNHDVIAEAGIPLISRTVPSGTNRSLSSRIKRGRNSELDVLCHNRNGARPIWSNQRNKGSTQHIKKKTLRRDESRYRKRNTNWSIHHRDGKDSVGSDYRDQMRTIRGRRRGGSEVPKEDPLPIDRLLHVFDPMQIAFPPFCLSPLSPEIFLLQHRGERSVHAIPTETPPENYIHTRKRSYIRIYTDGSTEMTNSISALRSIR